MSVRRAASIVVAALVLAQGVVAPARADDADKDKPINFSSDTGGYSNATNSGDLSGSSIITQGTLTLHADRITFKRNPDNSFSAIAYGNPVSFRQRREGTDEYDEGYANRIAYDGQKQLVELFDHALLKRGPTNELRSDYISYNRATDYASVGTPPGAATASRPVSRVTGVILPKDVNAADPGKGDKSAPAGKAPGAAPNAGTTSKPSDAKPADSSPRPADDAKSAAPVAKPDAATPAPLTIDTDIKSK